MPTRVATRVRQYVQRLLNRYVVVGPTFVFRCELERYCGLLQCAQ